MKKSFNVVGKCVIYGTKSVEAENLEEAIKFAEDNIDELPLPYEPEYIDGSYKIDKESTILLDEYFKHQEKE